MSLNIIAEVCYTCQNCLVVKQVCQLHRTQIMNIYHDKCNKYCQRKMSECKICGSYVIEIAQHVSNYHHKTMQEYKILTQDMNTRNNVVRRKNLWE